MAFKATDLPEPVVPAANRCGILERSATNTAEISSPRAMVNFDCKLSYTSDFKISLKKTVALLIWNF